MINILLHTYSESFKKKKNFEIINRDFIRYFQSNFFFPKLVSFSANAVLNAANRHHRILAANRERPPGPGSAPRASYCSQCQLHFTKRPLFGFLSPALSSECSGNRLHSLPAASLALKSNYTI